MKIDRGMLVLVIAILVGSSMVGVGSGSDWYLAPGNGEEYIDSVAGTVFLYLEIPESYEYDKVILWSECSDIADWVRQDDTSEYGFTTVQWKTKKKSGLKQSFVILVVEPGELVELEGKMPYDQHQYLFELLSFGQTKFTSEPKTPPKESEPEPVIPKPASSTPIETKIYVQNNDDDDLMVTLAYAGTYSSNRLINSGDLTFIGVHGTGAGEENRYYEIHWSDPDRETRDGESVVSKTGKHAIDGTITLVIDEYVKESESKVTPKPESKVTPEPATGEKRYFKPTSKPTSTSTSTKKDIEFIIKQEVPEKEVKVYVKNNLNVAVKGRLEVQTRDGRKSMEKTLQPGANKYFSTYKVNTKDLVAMYWCNPIIDECKYTRAIRDGDTAVITLDNIYAVLPEVITVPCHEKVQEQIYFRNEPNRYPKITYHAFVDNVNIATIDEGTKDRMANYSYLGGTRYVLLSVNGKKEGTTKVTVSLKSMGGLLLSTREVKVVVTPKLTEKETVVQQRELDEQKDKGEQYLADKEAEHRRIILDDMNVLEKIGFVVGEVIGAVVDFVHWSPK